MNGVILPTSVMIRIKNMRKIVSPYYSEYEQPNSYDLHLGDEFLVPKHYRLPRVLLEDEIEYIKVKDEICLHKNDFCLGTTVERVMIPAGKCAYLAARSSVARYGIGVHVSAGFIDTGFNGQITLELINFAPYVTKLEKGMKIAQLIVMDSEFTKMYDGHYQNQIGVTPAKKQ